MAGAETAEIADSPRFRPVRRRVPARRVQLVGGGWSATVLDDAASMFYLGGSRLTQTAEGLLALLVAVVAERYSGVCVEDLVESLAAQGVVPRRRLGRDEDSHWRDDVDRVRSERSER